MATTSGTLRTRRFTGSRHKSAGGSAGAGTLAEAGARTHAGALAEARTRARGSTSGRAARGVHGTACAGGSWCSAGSSTRAGTLAGAARASIEDGTSALDASGSCCALRRGWSWCGRRGCRCGIDRTRAGLRHDDAAWHRCGRSDLNRCFSGSCGNRGLGGSLDRRQCRGWKRCDNRWLRDYGGRWRRDGNHFAQCRRVCYSRSGRTGSDDGRFGDHRTSRGLRGNGWSLRRRHHDRGSLARLRHNSAWSGWRCGLGCCRNLCRALGGGSLGYRYRSCGHRCDRSCTSCRCGSRGRCGWSRRGARCLRGRLFLFLLNRLEYVTRLRNARPVDLRFGRSSFDA